MLNALEIAQKDAERQRLELIQAHKMASLGTLVSGIAHEINNPNNVIMLNADILGNLFEQVRPVLEERFKADPEFRFGPRKYSEIRDDLPLLVMEVKTSTRRIADMIDELRRFSRNEKAVISGVNINDTIQSALRLMRHEIDSHTTRLSTSLAEGLPAVKGNAQRIEQVVINLLNNACQALQDTGRGIFVSTSLSGDGREILIQVRDEGRGIAPEDLAMVGTPFFTTRAAEGGTGLGLSVSQNIVREHGGTMVFESEVGKGTIVTVRLPVSGPCRT